MTSSVIQRSTRITRDDPSHETGTSGIERVAYAVGGVLIVSGLIHLVILIIGGGTWQGPLSLRKPATFGLSFGLTLINVTLIAAFLPLTARWRTRLIGMFSAACIVETVLVSLQAWRGVPSHFNVQTPFDAAIAQSLAVGGFTIVAIIVALTVAALRGRARLPRALGLAIGAGLVALVGSQVVGGAMIASGMREVFTGNPTAAYAVGGWLKPVHAILMHGVLVLPLVAWLAARIGWDERRQIRTVWAAIVLYAIAAAAIATAVVSRDWPF
jgi:hypothetical protein